VHTQQAPGPSPEELAEGAKGAQSRPHRDGTPEQVAPVENYLNAVDVLIRRVLGAGSASSKHELLNAKQQLHGMVAGAHALGLQTQLAQVFKRHGAPGEHLLKDALSPPSSARPAQGSAHPKAEIAPTRSAISSAAVAQGATAQQQARPSSAGSGGGGVGGAISALATLVAAPITVPIAAGSLVWQRLAQRFGPRPAIPVNADAFSVMKNQFDDACNRAIAKISHIRSGPMNPIMSEMVANPLKLDEQFQRMAQDTSGEFHDRAQRMKETLGTPEMRRHYAELRAALEDVHHRSQRLAEAGVEHGAPVDEHIAARVEELAHKAEGLPALGKDGRLQQLKDAIREFVERIHEFLRNLFSKPGATPA
jgi:hypothetical protein